MTDFTIFASDDGLADERFAMPASKEIEMLAAIGRALPAHGKRRLQMAAHGLALEERSSEFGHAHCGAQSIRVICSPLQLYDDLELSM